MTLQNCNLRQTSVVSSRCLLSMYKYINISDNNRSKNTIDSCSSDSGSSNEVMLVTEGLSLQ